MIVMMMMMIKMFLPSSYHPLNLLTSIFSGDEKGDGGGGGGGGGGIDRRVDVASKLLLRVDT